MSSAPIDRRGFLRAGAAGGAALAGLSGLALDSPLARALAAEPRCGRLSDIEHVVILVQENRSFDSYFGTYRGVRGFGDDRAIRQADGRPIFSQPGYDVPGYGGHLDPFHFDTRNRNGECVNDVDHGWPAQHHSYDGGRLDHFVIEHLKTNGAANGPNTMGYYRRADLAFYYALADAFTICDQYFCSVIGPTDPNRLYTVAASINPDGKHGPTYVSTAVTDRASRFGTLDYTTMPEQLEARGISWKVYADPDGNLGDNVLPYFKAYVDGRHPTLTKNALTPTFPGQFRAEALAGTLPQVSWVLAPLIQTEHPPAPIAFGEDATFTVLDALTANPKVWEKTALLVTWDENGGFFDHVVPPTPPPGTPGEYLTVDPLPADAKGIRGPIGLGFRVPLLIVSPFARGGFVSSDVFDHTSLLRFLETRFGAEVPNLTRWRRSAVGDLTSAFNFAAPDGSMPNLPNPALDRAPFTSDCPTNAPVSQIDEDFPTVRSYDVPPNMGIPAQERGRARRPSGVVACSPGGGGRRGGGGGAGGAGVARSPGGSRRSPRGGVEAGRGGAARASADGPSVMPLALSGTGALLAIAGAGVAWLRHRMGDRHAEGS